MGFQYTKLEKILGEKPGFSFRCVTFEILLHIQVEMLKGELDI